MGNNASGAVATWLRGVRNTLGTTEGLRAGLAWDERKRQDIWGWSPTIDAPCGRITLEYHIRCRGMG